MPCPIPCPVEEYHQDNNALNGNISANVWCVYCQGSLLKMYVAD